MVKAGFADIERLTDYLESEKGIMSISKQHAYSLRRLVGYFKGMVESGHIPEAIGRSDGLTTGYCDELLEALKDD